MLKDLFSETMQEMLEAEMDTTLGYWVMVKMKTLPNKPKIVVTGIARRR